MSSELTSKPIKSKAVGQRYLNFSLGQKEYAIPLLTVKEVLAVPDVTPIPFTPAHFLGAMNLRGQVITVIDLRAKLGIKSQSGPETAVIICDLAPLCLGFVADSINSVLSPAPSEISEKQEVQTGKNTDYIEGVFQNDKKIVTVIDIAKALNVEDLRTLANRKKQSVA